MRDVNEVSEGRDGLKAKCESYGGVGQTTEETTPIDEALVADLAVHNLRVDLTSTRFWTHSTNFYHPVAVASADAAPLPELVRPGACAIPQYHEP
jgi:hypothetical protein